nr:putative reverse transcriptase domain-containing protein [Tanacetum cinerariifolium]
MTTTVFADTTRENTSFAYRASTSANRNLMISPNFVEANYEAQNGNPSAEGTSAYHSQGGYIPQTFTNNGIPSYNGSILSKSPREILTTEKVARSFKQPPHMFGSRRSRDMSKYCHFHEYHMHETNDCRQLRRQIEEAVKSGQLSHLVKGIKKERAIASKIDSKVPLIGFSGEKSLSSGEIPLEIMIGDRPTCKVGNPQLCHHKDKRKNEEGQRNASSKQKRSFQLHKGIRKGIPRTIMIEGKPFKTKHKLNKYNHIKPIKQKRRGLDPDCNTTACKEVKELTKAWILQKVKHQKWVANPVMVESLLGFRLKCFLDAYKGYHWIQMAETDEDRTTFFAGERVFCYQKMCFGLKNAAATYQRLLDKVFHDQIERNLMAYVDIEKSLM